MSVAVGIDLGTTNSVISYFKRGRAETIPLDGKNTFPSVISINNGRVTAGYPAKAKLVMDSSNTIGSTKRDIGTNVKYIVGGNKMTPTEVACEILKAMKEKAEFALGEKIKDAVITIPAYFKSEQREATKKAAIEAGFNVLRLMPEPSAAAVCYGLNQGKDQTIMVYDLGGGTFDVSIMKVKGNNFEVIAVDGDSWLGGDDFDQKICQVLYERVKYDIGIDLSVRKEREYMAAKQKIKEGAEKAKIELSSRESTDILIPNILNGYNVDYELSRDEYYDIIKPLLYKSIKKVKSVLEHAKLNSDDIDRLILVGGSTKAPIIKEMLKKEVRDPFVAPNVDEVVSHGAAIMAASLHDSLITNQNKYFMEEDKIDVIEKVVFTYGINLLSEGKVKFCHIVERDTPLPAIKGRLAVTSYEFQETVEMKVYRGENEDLDNDEEIGLLELKISKPTKKEVFIGAIFEIDNDMIIHFTGVEIPNNKDTIEMIKDAIENDGELNIKMMEELIHSNKVRSKKVDIRAK